MSLIITEKAGIYEKQTTKTIVNVIFFIRSLGHEFSNNNKQSTKFSR